MTETVEVSVSQLLTIRGRFRSVKELEEAVVREGMAGCRQLYAEAFRTYQGKWLEGHREDYQAVRWRAVKRLTPMGLVEVPNRVIRGREAERGGYHSLLKMLLRGKGTKLLSPMMEKAALEAATKQNYRPAAERIGGWCQVKVSHWTVWKCVQYWGKKLQEQQARGWWADRAKAIASEVVVTEVDSGYLKRQRRGRLKRAAAYFLMHLGLHYTGRQRRLERKGRRDVVLEEKTWLVGTETIGIFGHRLRQQRERHYPRPAVKVVLSDGDEGLEWMRQREFEDSTWLLDRWHVTERVRKYVGNDQGEFRRIMAGVWASDSEQVLEALRCSSWRLRKQKPEEFRELFGYVLGNREGIDSFHQIPAHLRRSRGREEAAVRAGSGAIEKNVEVHINRRFKRQGRSWVPERADRLAKLYWLQQNAENWNHWWNKVCLSTIKVNPSWALN